MRTIGNQNLIILPSHYFASPEVSRFGLVSLWFWLGQLRLIRTTTMRIIVLSTKNSDVWLRRQPRWAYPCLSVVGLHPYGLEHLLRQPVDPEGPRIDNLTPALQY